MKESKKRKLAKTALIIGLVIVIVVIVVSNIHIIPTGYTGVKIRMGLILDKPVESGHLYITMPFIEEIHTVNNKMQDFRTTSKIWGETNDKTPVFAENVTVTYQINPEKSVWICKNVHDYSRNLMTDSIVSSALKIAMVNLSPESVSNRSIIEPALQEELTKSLNEKYGEGTVLVSKVIVGNMDFEDAYNRAIQERSIATQEKMRIEIENQTKISKAEAEKQVAILEAEAQAEKVRIAAEAEAEANKLISESLTEELINFKKIELWNGELPMVVGGTNSFLDINDFLGAE